MSQSCNVSQYIHFIYDLCLLQQGWHPVAVVLYTFTHKQYTEQHNETEYPERNKHNNKNTLHNNKNTKFTELNRSIQNIQPYIQWYKIKPEKYERMW